jgi:hypothetical protein
MATQIGYESELWTKFLAMPDLEQLLTKTKKELRQAPSRGVAILRAHFFCKVQNHGIFEFGPFLSAKC